MPLDRDVVIAMMREILVRQGKVTCELTPSVVLRDAGFRSLDFSELVLRVEGLVGREVDLSGLSLRQTRTVGDLVSFFECAFQNDPAQA